MAAMPWLQPLPSRSPALSKMPPSLRPAHTGMCGELSSSCSSLRDAPQQARDSAAVQSYPKPPMSAPVQYHRRDDLVFDPLVGVSRQVNPCLCRRKAPPKQSAKAAHKADRDLATVVDSRLSAKLSEVGEHSFRQVVSAHDEAFKAVCSQVALHCEERGKLLERLCSFYMRNMQTVLRQAANQAREEMQEKLRALDSKNSHLEQEIKALREKSFRHGMPEESRLALVFKEIEVCCFFEPAN
ncbi:MAG: hypothetical protein SGPRY_006742 [Prymnesium sp.]